MSTRSVVKVINGKKSCFLYHHYDGYITGLGFCLLKLLELYKAKSSKEYGWDANTLVKKMIEMGNFELTLFNHADIEYYYELNLSKGTLKAWSVDNWDGMKKLQEFDVEEEYALNKSQDCMVEEEMLNKMTGEE